MTTCDFMCRSSASLHHICRLRERHDPCWKNTFALKHIPPHGVEVKAGYGSNP